MNPFSEVSAVNTTVEDYGMEKEKRDFKENYRNIQTKIHINHHQRNVLSCMTFKFEQ